MLPLARRLRLPALAPLLVCASACEHALLDVGAPRGAGAEAAAPLIGVSGAGDFADRSCQIVLRGMGRVASGGGFATSGSRWIFEGRVDVSRQALDEGAAPFLLVKAGSDPSWRALSPVASTTLDGEATRFLFRVEDGDLPGPGISATGLARSKVSVLPYLQLGDARLFDHNRVPGDFDVYEMKQADGFRIVEDEDVCASKAAVIELREDFTEHVVGSIRAGADLVVRYDQDRLTTCRGTHNGHRGWTITAHARFLPGGEQQSAQVVGTHTVHGAPTGVADDVPATFRVPSTAQKVELWFQNTSVSGCEAWDSRFGANYVYDVEGSVDAPDWVGDVAALVSRSADGPCAGGQAYAGEIVYSTWARQRAAVTNLCFEVYERGTTDRDNPSLWRELDVQVHFRDDPSEPFSTQYVNVAGRDGDNAVYAVDLRALDPFAPYRCVTAPTETFTRGSEAWLAANVELFMTVNGVEVRPQAGGAFAVRYEDHASNPRPACE